MTCVAPPPLDPLGLLAGDALGLEILEGIKHIQVPESPRLEPARPTESPRLEPAQAPESPRLEPAQAPESPRLEAAARPVAPSSAASEPAHRPRKRVRSSARDPSADADAKVEAKRPRSASGPRARAAKSRSASAARQGEAREQASDAELEPAPARQYICWEPGCGRVFQDAYHLLRHTKSHAVKAFKCSCGRGFAEPDRLAAHEQTCNGAGGKRKSSTTRRQAWDAKWAAGCERVGCVKAPASPAPGSPEEAKVQARPVCRARVGSYPEAAPGTMYPCTICGVAFKVKSRLTAHLDTHRSWTERKLFACPHDGCGKTYLSSFARDQHVRAKHDGVRPFVCSCGATFAFKHKLQEHTCTPKPKRKRKKAEKSALGDASLACFADTLFVGGEET